MKSTEKKILLEKRLKEGENINQAANEVNHFLEVEMGFDAVKREVKHLRKELERKDELINESREKQKKEKNKDFLAGLGYTPNKLDSKQAIMVLKRMKRFLKEEYYTKEKICNRMLAKKEYVDMSLNVLIALNLCEKKRINGVICYKIKNG